MMTTMLEEQVKPSCEPEQAQEKEKDPGKVSLDGHLPVEGAGGPTQGDPNPVYVPPPPPGRC